MQGVGPPEFLRILSAFKFLGPISLVTTGYDIPGEYFRMWANKFLASNN